MRDTWMNQCIVCMTNNPSVAFHRPAKCAGCGLKLECVRQYPGEADGLFGHLRRVTDNKQRSERRKHSKVLREKWEDHAKKMGLPLDDDDD